MAQSASLIPCKALRSDRGKPVDVTVTVRPTSSSGRRWAQIFLISMLTLQPFWKMSVSVQKKNIHAQRIAVTSNTSSSGAGSRQSMASGEISMTAATP